MISHFRNILNLNEKFAYSILGIIRRFIVPFSDMGLRSQEKRVKRNIVLDFDLFKANLGNILPAVSAEELKNSISNEEEKVLLNIANKAIQHEFNILSINAKFGKNLDWSLDFSSGYRWPKGKLYRRYNEVNVANNADVKFPRELSRCHHFLNLGQAYLLTGDEKFTTAYIGQLRSWLKENPYKKSINWCCSMDIGIRAANWIHSLRMFSKSTLINKEFLVEIFTSLYLHSRYIYENPEKNRAYNHNHYLSDLSGQILMGLLFEKQDLKESRLWRDNGIYELFREIRIQILPTGFTYERSTNYHRLVTELISYTIILLKNNEIEVPQDILFRVKKMFEVLPEYLFLNGQAPVIGDQDNGRFLPFFPYNVNYHQYLLNIAVALFENPILQNIRATEKLDVLFLFGQKGVNKLQKFKPTKTIVQSKSFPDAGFYTLRSNSVFVFINHSGLSHYNEVTGNGTHTHADLLSFIYAYNGVPFLIDPGSYVYSSNPKERMKFRSTGMHNTVTIDNFNQNELEEHVLWSMKRDALPTVHSWIVGEQKDVFEGSHNGFERLKDPVAHIRRFELDKKSDQVIITDTIRCSDMHEVKCHFHFDNEVDVTNVNGEFLCKRNAETIRIRFDLSTKFDIQLIEEYISKAYNSKVLAPYGILTFKTEKSVELKTVIENFSDDF